MKTGGSSWNWSTLQRPQEQGAAGIQVHGRLESPAGDQAGLPFARCAGFAAGRNRIGRPTSGTISGLLTYGIAYSLDGQPPKEIVLGANMPGKAASTMPGNWFRSSRCGTARPVALRITSSPTTPAPTANRGRTSSDMFFCEVRPFEEIFRQGERRPAASLLGPRPGSRQAGRIAKAGHQRHLEIGSPRDPTEPTAEFAERRRPGYSDGQLEALSLADELEAEAEHAPNCAATWKRHASRSSRRSSSCNRPSMGRPFRR